MKRGWYRYTNFRTGESHEATFTPSSVDDGTIDGMSFRFEPFMQDWIRPDGADVPEPWSDRVGEGAPTPSRPPR